MHSVIYDHFLIFLLWLFVFFGFVFWFVYITLNRKLITILSTTLIMKIFIPLILMYPFALSPKNMTATGYYWYYNYLNYIDKAFLISIIGIMSFIFGCLVAKSKPTNNFPILSSASKSLKFISKPFSLLIFSLVLVGLFLLIYTLGNISLSNSIRTYGMANPNVRPFANLILALLPLFLSLSLFLSQYKRLIGFIFIFIGLIIGFASGTRSAVLGGILFFIFAKLNFQSNKKNNFLKSVIMGIILLFLAIYIGDLREGQYNLLITIDNLYKKVFFGNNFSDLRDFSWVLSGWDGNYLFGKTQLAGLLSFIPSSISSFRSEWGLGVFTTRVLGFDHSIHPGLRPGIFGESYFNFGYIGVVIFGLLYGYIIYRIHLFAENSLKIQDKYQSMINLLSAYIVANLTTNLMITAGFFNVFVNGGIIGFGFLLTKIKTSKI